MKKRYLALLPAALYAMLCIVHSTLRKRGALNNQDLFPAGSESGTLYEYATNVWMWDAVLLVMMLATAIAALILLTIAATRFVNARR
jgi:hypothetical protein